MNPSVAIPSKAITMQSFILKKENELSFCKKLSDLGSPTENKDFSSKCKLIHCIEEVIDECNQLIPNYTNIHPRRNYSRKILRKVQFFKNLIGYLQNDYFSEYRDLIQFVEEEIQECKQLIVDCIVSNPGGLGDKRLNEKLSFVNESIKSLKKKTKFFENKKVYEDDILVALEKATEEFKIVAD